jgi:membrane protein DedA with SNARE-associated domain
LFGTGGKGDGQYRRRPLDGLIEQFPLIGLFSLLILGGLGFPFPEDTTLLLAGYLVSRRIVAPVPAFLVVYAGLLAADLLLHGVGMRYGRSLLEHRWFRRILSAGRLQTLELKFNRWGVWVIVVGRHVWGLRAQLFLVAGVMRMPTLKFFLADGTTALLTIAFMGGMGYIGGNSLEALRKGLTRAEHVAGVTIPVLIVAVAGYYYFRNHGREKRS